MSDLLLKVKSTVQREQLLAENDGVVASVSGGADSVVMLHVLTRLPVRKLQVVTFDHGLRRESRGECELVRALAKHLNLECSVISLGLREGPGLYVRAREARYQSLRELAGQCKIATAHTRSDQAETVLMRLMRGSGLRGLAGVPYARDGIIRPLLDCSRRDVETYAHLHALPYVVDPSNQDVRHLRAFTRHQLLPLMAQRDPAIEAHLAQISRQAQTASEVRDRTHREVTIDELSVAELRGLPPPALHDRFARLLAPRSLSRGQSAELSKLVSAGKGVVYLSKGFQVSVVQPEGRLRLEEDLNRPSRSKRLVRPKLDVNFIDPNA